MPVYSPPAPPVSPCPRCGRAPSTATLIGSDPPIESGAHASCCDHYVCRCAACNIAYRAGAVRLLRLLPPTPG